MSPRPDESTPTAISNVRKRRHYSVDFKLKVITEAKEKSVHSASRVNHLDRATVRDWIKHKEELQQLRWDELALLR
jgi:transposase-like protein